MRKNCLCVLLCVLVFLLSLIGDQTTARAQECVPLGWDANTESDLAGYQIHYGYNARAYVYNKDVLGATQLDGQVYYTLQDEVLVPGVTLFIAVTAVDTAGNESGYSNEVVFTVPPNLPPEASNSSLIVAGGSSPQGGMLVASDPDGGALVYSLVQQAEKGVVIITDVTTGEFVYQPYPQSVGEDVFAFSVSDGSGTSNVGYVTVFIENQQPVAVNGGLVTNEDTSAVGSILASDGNNDPLIFTVVSQPTKGTVTLNAETGTYSYVPNANVNGTDSFTFNVNDGLDDSNLAVVNITISPVNDAPVAYPGALTAFETAQYKGYFNGSDIDGDALSYLVVSLPSKGILTNSGAGAFTYTANPGSTGSDQFTFKVNDGKVDSTLATVSVEIRSHVYIWLESEGGIIMSPMVIAGDSNASGGNYIWVPNGTGNITEPGNGGQAQYIFSLEDAGAYYIYGRTSSPGGVADNRFFISVDGENPITWNPALSRQGRWVWSRVKEGATAKVAEINLLADLHTLMISQAEDGTKLDKLLLTTNPNYLGEVVYESAEDFDTYGWDVYLGTGATITNVFDDNRDGRVIKLQGSGITNGYRFRNGTANWPWNVATRMIFSLDVKAPENFQKILSVQTSMGARTFVYYISGLSSCSNTFVQYCFDLGSGMISSEWNGIVLDPLADLKSVPNCSACATARILNINYPMLKGSLSIDDIGLRSLY